MKTKVKDNELLDKHYLPFPRPKFIWPFAAFFIVLITIINNINLSEKIEYEIVNELNQLRECPLKYDKLEVNTFWPRVSIINPIIPEGCFGAVEKDVPLKDLSLSFSGLGLYPLGIKFSLNLAAYQSNFQLKYVLARKNHFIFVNNGKLNLADLRQLLPIPVEANGILDLEGQIILAFNGDVTNAEITAGSNDLILSKQIIEGLELPEMPLKKFQLISEYSIHTKKLVINKFEVGVTESPIQAQITGDITPNWNNMDYSQLNLELNTQFSKSFLEDFSLVKLLLKQYEKDEGNYSLMIKGTVQRPQKIPNR